MEVTYEVIIRTMLTYWKLAGINILLEGEENFPRKDAALIAINHTAYTDFTFAGYPAYQTCRRKIRFMAKKETFENPYTGPIMRALRHIPVDRNNGGPSYQTALEYLQKGELVGIYPESTISLSFEIKEFKSGMGRLAWEAKVPIIPIVIWGAHRHFTVGHKNLGRSRLPIMITVLPPVSPDSDIDKVTNTVRTSMSQCLHDMQERYEHPAGQWWVPQRLGGSAPTIEEAERAAQERQRRKNERKLSREKSSETEK